MYLSNKRILIIAVSVFTVLMMLFALVLAFPASNGAADVGGDITIESITANSGSQFNNSAYKNFFGVKSEEIASFSNNGGGMEVNGSKQLIDYVFDGSSRTVWNSQQANSDTFKNQITVNFTKTLSLKSIQYLSSYYSSGNTRNFSGYPTVLKIYAANGDDNFKLAGTCESTPTKNFSENVVFTLPQAVECDKIIFEFAEVSVYSRVFNGAAIAAAMEISFFKSDDGYTQTVKAEGDFANTSYLSSNSVLAEEMKIRTNGGGTIANAFDKSTSTLWQSESYNTDIFKNKITLTFEKEQMLSSIVYGCSYYTRNNVRRFSGYPTQFTATATKANGAQTKYCFYGTPANDWSMARFVFPESVVCEKLELEFTEVTVMSEIAGGAPVAVTSELFIMKSPDAGLGEVLEEINGIFTDYAQYEIKEGYTVEKLNELRGSVKNSTAYEKSLKPILDRAEAILTGAMRKDVYREFSTDPNSRNPLEQNGDLVDYCRNTLQHSSFGTNRQVIGIGGTTGETITIYVDAPEGDPLPSVAFTQIYGAWNSWMRTFTLHRGKNEIVFPNFKANGGYSRAIAAGGPIHVINPYTPEQQSSNVKMYIEGGYLYPVFHDGDDEGTFRVILTDFYERLSDPDDSSITVDAFEAVSGNVILSCTASLAYASYVRGGSSPQFNIDKWRKYTVETLAFGGVEFEEGQPHYDPRNNFIKANYRIVQPYAGMYAFAYTEHIGIIDTATFGAMVQKWTLGWAFSHEFGHMLDNMRMKQPETTNNMWAIYNIYMTNGAFNDRIKVSNVSKYLASDFSEKVGNYHGNGNDNCDFWWIMEGAFPGYWGKLQQLYCFETSGADVTDATEKLCYFSSLATGNDVSNYFERWGFYFKSEKFTSTNRFAYEKTSQQFKDAMAAAKSEGRITGEGKKIWYVNNDQYKYTRQNGGKISAEWASCYDSTQQVRANDIMGASGSYTLLLPAPQNAQAHLCYEIQSFIDGKWQVLGVTYGTSFTDTYAYGEGVTPQYKIYAYDRTFNRTGDAAAATPSVDAQTDVCRIGDVKYNTLKEAVAAASAGDTIYLLKDFKDGGIALNKALTIIPDPDVFTDNRPVTITKNSSGHLFSVSASVTIGTATSPIILDGNSFAQNGSLVYIDGRHTLNMINVTMQNNLSSSSGGGIQIQHSSTVNLTDCIIRNNSASDGGGIFMCGLSTISVNNLTLTGNSASSRGGGICVLEHYGNSYFRNRNARGNVVISNNRAANGGGIYTQNFVELYDAQISDNVATANGGGVYCDIDQAHRSIQLIGCTLSGNEAVLGNALFMYRGKTILDGGKISGILYKHFGGKPASVFELKNSLPDLSEAEIRLSKVITEDGEILCEGISGMSADIITEGAPTFNVLNGRAEFQSGVGVVVYPVRASVTINYGNGTFITEMNYGTYVLPERFDELPEGKYIEKYTIDGKEYKTGESVIVTGSFTAVATLKDYYTVKLFYGTQTETLLMRQNAVYYLPMKTPDGETVFGWNRSDGKFYAYAEGVEISANTVFNAIIKRLHTVKTVVNGIETEAQYEYGGSVTLPSPPAIFGKAFSHWEIDGKKYRQNQTVKVTSDIVAIAIYTDSWQVTTVIEDGEEIKSYPNGSVIILPSLEQSLGREFKYWTVNGVKYYAGSSYTVSCDTEMIAVFAQVNTANKITVTTIVNKGSAGGDANVENEIDETQYSFNQEFVFPEPKVNEGNKFLYWEVNGVKYTAGSKIAVKEPFTAIAVVTQVSGDEATKSSFTVTIKNFVNGEYVTATYEYAANATLTLPQPSDYPSNKLFKYWLINGVQYDAGATIVIDADAEAVAVFEDIIAPPPEENDPDGDDKDDDNNQDEKDGGSKVGVIVGVIVAVVALAGAGVAVTVVVLKKKSASKSNKKDD